MLYSGCGTLKSCGISFFYYFRREKVGNYFLELFIILKIKKVFIKIKILMRRIFRYTKGKIITKNIIL